MLWMFCSLTKIFRQISIVFHDLLHSIFVLVHNLIYKKAQVKVFQNKRSSFLWYMGWKWWLVTRFDITMDNKTQFVDMLKSGVRNFCNYRVKVTSFQSEWTTKPFFLWISSAFHWSSGTFMPLANNFITFFFPLGFLGGHIRLKNLHGATRIY
jgi:hypothetical protein